MKGGEAKFWNELRIPLNAMGDVDRIESHATSIGRPDLNLCLDPGIEWNIELKYSDAGKIVLRPSQRMWFSKRRRVRAKACVLTKVVSTEGKLYLLNSIWAIPDGDALEDWINTAHCAWDDKINYNELEEYFRAEK